MRKNNMTNNTSIIREKFDYTRWQRNYFDAKTPEEISIEATNFEIAHHFTGNIIELLICVSNKFYFSSDGYVSLEV